MRIVSLSLLAALAVTTAVSCGGGSGASSPPPQSQTALVIFDEIWTDFDQTYSFFVLKNIDWAGSRTRFRAQLTSSSTDAMLMNVVADMLLELEDAHVRLETPSGIATYTGWFDQFPENFDKTVVSATYLQATEQLSPQAGLTFGSVSPGLGYIHVDSLSRNGIASDLGFILGQLGALDGLVVDLRNNGGGNDQNGHEFVELLASANHLYRRVRFRNGPNHNDFGPFIDGTLMPSAPALYSGPIAVLTNRRTVSSAETMVLAFRALPNVVSIGDFSGGASANPVSRVASNGWQYTISQWIEYLPDNTTFEGIGLAPDIRVDITAADMAAQRDTILDAAIADLQSRL